MPRLPDLHLRRGHKDTLLRRTETDGVAGKVLSYSYDGSNRLPRAQATSGGTGDYKYGYNATADGPSVTRSRGDIHEPGRDNRYICGGADPINRVDTTGREWWDPSDWAWETIGGVSGTFLMPGWGSAVGFAIGCLIGLNVEYLSNYEGDV